MTLFLFQIKCFQYWPNDGDMLHFDELTLITTGEVTSLNGDCVIRKIEVSKARNRLIQIGHL